MKRNILFLLALVCVCIACDREKNELRKGNKAFDKSEFKQAEEAYRAALAADTNYAKAEYNLANALYKQGKDDKLHMAAGYYEAFLKSQSSEDSLNRANGTYNFGNAVFGLSQSDTVKNTDKFGLYLKKAAECYKESLRLNPSDSNAKYNLALTQYLLKKNEEQKKNNKQQQSQQQQNQNGKSKNQNGDSEKQNADSKKRNGDSQNQNGERENREQNAREAQAEKRDKQEVNRMLEALKNNEKNTLNKIKHRREGKAQKRRVEKDW